MRSDGPDIAVIIPCFNNEAFLKQAIESVLEQRGPRVETIVIDDGSSDGSVAIASAYGDRVRVISQANQGACVARNRGLAETSAPYVKFLDADDYLAPDALNQQFEAIEALSSDSLVFGDAEWVDENGSHLSDYRLERGAASPELSVAEVIEITPLTSSPLHRRSHLEQVGGFDPRCLRSQEFDLHVRLALSGFRFTYLPGLIFHYRQHQVGTRVSSHDSNLRIQESKFDSLERLERMAAGHEATQDQHQVSLQLGRAFWRVGRLASRSGNFELARRCFGRAKELGGRNSIVGSSKYKLLSQVFRFEWLR